MSAQPTVSLPFLQLPALVLTGSGVVLALASGETNRLSAAEARQALSSGDVLVCHMPFVAHRLNTKVTLPPWDLLELFAFARPAEACLPSPLGLARALHLRVPRTPEDCARSLRDAAAALFDWLARLPAAERESARRIASSMTKAGWRWGPAVLSVIGEPERMAGPLAGLDVWHALPKWEDEPPAARPSNYAVEAAEAVARLAMLTSQGAERRQQRDFTIAAATAFAPRERAGSPRMALAEAGTGTGKTLGYLAPASLWAEKNGPGVWISTYTRNLQRQILQETEKLRRAPHTRELKIVLRKGRENYLCLLNFEEAVKRSAHVPAPRLIALALIARWLAATANGDLSGATFPAFLAAHLPMRELTDRRGECIYAACPHYRTCFIERGIRSARGADIVIANHALVMANAMRAAAGETPDGPVRYVFDEGHHLFDAADSAFAGEISGSEMAELRRWIRGSEGRQSRARGLGERLRELLVGEDAAKTLEEAIAAAGALAGDAWLSRVRSGAARGPGEIFLERAYAHVRARSGDGDSQYGIEAEARPLPPELRDAARKLDHWLTRLIAPLQRMASCLRVRLDDEAAELDSNMRARLEGAARGLERRAQVLLPSWRAMLASLEEEPGQEPEFADWFEILRGDGRDIDVALRRHWIDPTIPFAETILKPAHGALITSATLRDTSGETGGDGDWRVAEVRVGAHHLPEPPQRALFGSPFDWKAQARILVVRDIDRRDWDQLAAAYRELFLASGGGALGLFTAVKTMKAVHVRVAAPLAAAGLMLYAQHVDALDTGTLVDLFRAEENACLFGTDALRDGIDVPGRSLRLCVFDKVPWPKPTILHKARRGRFGKTYDDLLARLRLKQAFGRLIRSERDKGVFVILDGACPNRLLASLPPEVPVARCGLQQAIAETRRFLGDTPL